MKINNHGISGASMTPKQGISAPGVGTGKDSTDAIAPESNAYSPSAEWLRMLDLVRQQPEVREDRVQEVIERLRRGEYSSPESVEKTADAMLQSAD